MDEKTYNVHITTPNHQVVFRNRPIRTPALFNGVCEKELQLLKTQIFKESINATIEEVDTKSEETFEIGDVELDKEVEVEELYSSNTKTQSTLEKLLKDE